jgi:hypothetical protein
LSGNGGSGGDNGGGPQVFVGLGARISTVYSDIYVCNKNIL